MRIERDEDQGAEPPEVCFAWEPSLPQDGEGLLGWLLRESSAQHVPSIGVVLSQATSRLNLRVEQRIGSRLDVEILSRVTMTEPDVVAGLMYPGVDDERVRFLDATIPRWHVESRRRRFSPETLAEKGISPAVWEHKSLPFCPYSWEYLTDRCPARRCRARLTWHWAAGVDGCPSCGGKLTGGTRRKVPGEWQDRLLVVASLTSGAPPASHGALIPPILHDADPGDVLELVYALFPLCGERPLTTSTSRWWQRRPIRLARTLADAIGLLADWPDRVLERVASVSGRSGDATTQASAVLRGKLVRPGSAAAMALGELVQGVRAHGPGRTLGSDAALSILTTSQLLGCGTAITADARRRGLLKTVPMLRGSELVLGFDRADVAAVVDHFRHRTTTWKVATRIGVPRYAAEDLADVGALITSDHPYCRDRYGKYSFDGRDVQSFITSLEERSEHRLRANTTLAAVMFAVGGRLKPWAEILVAIHTGELKARIEAGPQSLIERTSIRMEDVRDLVSSGRRRAAAPVRKNRHVTRGDVLEILNLSQKFYRPLTGLLGDREMIPIAEALALARNVISAAEIRARWHVDPRRVTSLIRETAPETVRHALGWPRRQVEALGPRLAAMAQISDRISNLK